MEGWRKEGGREGEQKLKEYLTSSNFPAHCQYPAAGLQKTMATSELENLGEKREGEWSGRGRGAILERNLIHTLLI